jgi:hypothetical protein
LHMSVRTAGQYKGSKYGSHHPVVM